MKRKVLMLPWFLLSWALDATGKNNGPQRPLDSLCYTPGLTGVE